MVKYRTHIVARRDIVDPSVVSMTGFQSNTLPMPYWKYSLFCLKSLRKGWLLLYFQRSGLVTSREWMMLPIKISPFVASLESLFKKKIIAPYSFNRYLVKLNNGYSRCSQKLFRIEQCYIQRKNFVKRKQEKFYEHRYCFCQMNTMEISSSYCWKTRHCRNEIITNEVNQKLILESRSEWDDSCQCKRAYVRSSSLVIEESMTLSYENAKDNRVFYVRSGFRFHTNPSNECMASVWLSRVIEDGRKRTQIAFGLLNVLPRIFFVCLNLGFGFLIIYRTPFFLHVVFFLLFTTVFELFT